MHGINWKCTDLEAILSSNLNVNILSVVFILYSKVKFLPPVQNWTHPPWICTRMSMILVLLIIDIRGLRRPYLAYFRKAVSSFHNYRVILSYSIPKKISSVYAFLLNLNFLCSIFNGVYPCTETQGCVIWGQMRADLWQKVWCLCYLAWQIKTIWSYSILGFIVTTMGRFGDTYRNWRLLGMCMRSTNTNFPNLFGGRHQCNISQTWLVSLVCNLIIYSPKKMADHKYLSKCLRYIPHFSLF